MTRHVRQWRAWGIALGVMAASAAACSSDKATGPAPCDTYSGGTFTGNTGGLPGAYDLTSFCSGVKPDLVPPAATGTVTITDVDFSAAITIQGTLTTYSGTYTTSNPDGITVDLTSPLPATFVGTFRLRNDSLAVSGTASGQRLSFVGTRTGL